VVEAADLSTLPNFDEIQPKLQGILTMALNGVAKKTRTKFDRAIRSEINFPASYLRPSAQRLWVKQRATRSRLEAVIQGRGRATSLARFSRQRPGSKGPISVEVKPGHRVTLDRAFLVNLNVGAAKPADGLRNPNVGLAVRTNGEKPRGAYKPARLGKNTWLLYGPSVDQALLGASTGAGIAVEMSAEALEMLSAEVNRLLVVKGVL
jgi:hypothetical protein